ncbi:MAG: addiction module toxin RelE [Clostridia bacterium]|nr:addiction module toxin RelE [Clostridia bacterium]
MTREFVWTTAFLSGWRRCGFGDDDLRRLEDVLLDNPNAGDLIQGTGGARKLRFEFEGRGKSGSSRVIYVDFISGETICGLAVYAKADKSSLTQGEKNTIKRLIQLLKNYYDSPGEREG